MYNIFQCSQQVYYNHHFTIKTIQSKYILWYQISIVLGATAFTVSILQEEFEDTKGVIRICKSKKDRYGYMNDFLPTDITSA